MKKAVIFLDLWVMLALLHPWTTTKQSSASVTADLSKPKQAAAGSADPDAGETTATVAVTAKGLRILVAGKVVTEEQLRALVKSGKVLCLRFEFPDGRESTQRLLSLAVDQQLLVQMAMLPEEARK